MAYFIAFKKPKTEQLSQETQVWIQQVTGEEKISVHELKKNTFLSISHTKGLLGFVLSQELIGLDIELKTREMTQKIAQYIRHEEDEIFNLKAWCIKEAAYKALSFYEKELSLKEIKIIKNKKIFYKNYQGNYSFIPHEDYLISLVENIKSF